MERDEVMKITTIRRILCDTVRIIDRSKTYTIIAKDIYDALYPEARPEVPENITIYPEQDTNCQRYEDLIRQQKIITWIHWADGQLKGESHANRP